MIAAQCAICGEPIRPDYWVCVPCRRQHELDAKFRQWPDWAKALVAEEQKRRRYEEEWHDRIITATELVEEGAQDIPNDGLGPFTGLFVRPAQVDGLPYAPYPTEAENVAYRKANGIPDK